MWISPFGSRRNKLSNLDCFVCIHAICATQFKTPSIAFSKDAPRRHTIEMRNIIGLKEGFLPLHVLGLHRWSSTFIQSITFLKKYPTPSKINRILRKYLKRFGGGPESSYLIRCTGYFPARWKSTAGVVLFFAVLVYHIISNDGHGHLPTHYFQKINHFDYANWVGRIECTLNMSDLIAKYRFFMCRSHSCYKVPGLRNLKLPVQSRPCVGRCAYDRKLHITNAR